ncbi:hypothetical protein Smp_194790 [Schistosoma mansoni]|uniref:hypothetical protein n=1 Tax=Schistosoma mansoni TaxID=6183 RepID=UPI00022DC3E4|nr:hypothetical protein Smp_194790 [Schistosoma mansoni]|eukprot:XP_018649412.1 hypothetical protein Smp_194790 [Schistosoma mansoni]
MINKAVKLLKDVSLLHLITKSEIYFKSLGQFINARRLANVTDLISFDMIHNKHHISGLFCNHLMKIVIDYRERNSVAA